MFIVLLLAFLFIALPFLAIWYGAESRTGFVAPVDWRPLRD